MSFTESWVETDPDGSVITGSLLDDYQRQTKRALRERLEGDPADVLTGIFESGSWALAPTPRAGTARVYYGTDAAMAALGASSRQDGRLALATDTGVLYHAAAAGMVALFGSKMTRTASTSPSFYVRDTASTELAAGALFSGAGESIVVQSHNSNARFAAVSYASPPQFIGYRGNGTSAATTQVVNGSVLASFQGRGYMSTGAWTTSGAAGVEIVGNESWTGTANGAYLTFFVTAAGGTATSTILTLASTGATFGVALADSNLATISTAGKVSNSATTATSADTASAIVARDSNGDFTARNITAAIHISTTSLLTRNATTGVIGFQDAGGTNKWRVGWAAGTGAGNAFEIYDDIAGRMAVSIATGATGAMTLTGGLVIAGTLTGVTSLTASTSVVIGADIGTAYALRVNGSIISTATELFRTTGVMTDGAGASAGTLGNAPAAGNPTKWLKVNDNGTIRYVPSW